MNWDPFKYGLQAFDDYVRGEQVRIAPDSAVAPQLALMREFLSDQDDLGNAKAIEKWMARGFKEFYDAIIIVQRLTDAVTQLSDNPAPLRSRLKQVLSGPLNQDFVPQPAKDILYELEIAAALKRAGFSVTLREPDVVVWGGGLTREIGLACKYPSSDGQVHAHLSKGYKQIDRQDLDGCVVLGLDLIIFRAAFNTPPQFLDFRQSRRHPREVASQLVGEAMASLVEQRKADYPSEQPLDGAILTFSAWGMFGQPTGFASLTAWSVQCTQANLIRPDLELIAKRAAALDTEQAGRSSGVASRVAP